MTENKFNDYVYVPQTIGIRTNIRDFRWGFGKCDSPASESEFDRCKIRIFLEERADKHVFDDIDTADYPNAFRHFKAAPGRQSVLFEMTVKGMIPLRYVLTVSGSEIRMTVGKSYRRLVRTKLMYIHPIAYILFDAVALLLLKNGMTTLYCSAVSARDGKAIVFMAPPNTGKSLCALKLKKDCGADIIAEDMAVTDGAGVKGAPFTNLYRNYHDKSLTDSTENLSAANAVDMIAVLQKGGSVFVKEPEKDCERLMLINHYSLGYYYSPCIRVLDYYNEGISIRKAEETERKILSRLLSTARYTVIENPDPMCFSDQVRSLIG